MSYPLITIANSTNYIIFGKVSYKSAFCSNNHYDATPDTIWKSRSRGACLVTKISAKVKTPNGDIVATPYISSGTSYSEFVVIQTSPNSFEVTRRVLKLFTEYPGKF